MSRGRRQTFSLAALLGMILMAGHTWSPVAMAGVVGASTSNFSASLQPPPKLPIGKCPQVELFRRLLEMGPEQRKEFLAPRSEAVRKLILAKVSEYEALSPAQRELRLEATEMWWYLKPLLSAAATNRQEQLAEIPPRVRKLVADRLEAWDRLPAVVQKRLLDPAADYLAKEAARVVAPPPLPPVPPDRRVLLEQGVRQWQELSEWQRQEITNRLNRVFDLTDQEKARILSVVSDNQRRQIKTVLGRFGNLTREQRAVCIQNFAKFADLPLPDRDRFLRNAQHWQRMSPTERATWKDLVNRLPPLPPGMNAAGLPPMPPAPSTSSPGEVSLGTNR